MRTSESKGSIAMIVAGRALVVTAPARIEYQRHQPAADHDREHDAQCHGDIEADGHVRSVHRNPQTIGVPQRGREQRQQREHTEDTHDRDMVAVPMNASATSDAGDDAAIDGSDPTYAYKPSLMGAPWEFSLTVEGLAWQLGRRSGLIRYDQVRRVRLAF